MHDACGVVTLHVFPSSVPGGPWISTTGEPSSPPVTAFICKQEGGRWVDGWVVVVVVVVMLCVCGGGKGGAGAAARWLQGKSGR